MRVQQGEHLEEPAVTTRVPSTTNFEVRIGAVPGTNGVPTRILG